MKFIIHQSARMLLLSLWDYATLSARTIDSFFKNFIQDYKKDINSLSFVVVITLGFSFWVSWTDDYLSYNHMVVSLQPHCAHTHNTNPINVFFSFFWPIYISVNIIFSLLWAMLFWIKYLLKPMCWIFSLKMLNSIFWMFSTSLHPSP